MKTYLIPTIIIYVIKINKDLLWKPLNHKLLLLTRSKLKSVKLISIYTLYQLFSQVKNNSQYNIFLNFPFIFFFKFK